MLLGAIARRGDAGRGFGRSGDTEATIAAVARARRAVSTRTTSTTLRVDGVGLRGLREPDGPLDCGNAGTLCACSPGILAGQEGASS